MLPPPRSILNAYCDAHWSSIESGLHRIHISCTYSEWFDRKRGEKGGKRRQKNTCECTIHSLAELFFSIEKRDIASLSRLSVCAFEFIYSTIHVRCQWASPKKPIPFPPPHNPPQLTSTTSNATDAFLMHISLCFIAESSCICSAFSLSLGRARASKNCEIAKKKKDAICCMHLIKMRGWAAPPFNWAREWGLKNSGHYVLYKRIDETVHRADSSLSNPVSVYQTKYDCSNNHEKWRVSSSERAKDRRICDLLAWINYVFFLLEYIVVCFPWMQRISSLENAFRITFSICEM